MFGAFEYKPLRHQKTEKKESSCANSISTHPANELTVACENDCTKSSHSSLKQRNDAKITNHVNKVIQFLMRCDQKQRRSGSTIHHCKERARDYPNCLELPHCHGAKMAN